MPQTFRLAYVEMTTPSLDQALSYYDGVLGATVVERAGESAYLSLGLDHHNLALRRADRASLGAVGLQLHAGVDPGELQARLKGMSLDVAVKTDARPGVPRLLEVAIGGHTFHLLPEMATAAPGFSGRGVNPVRLGPVAVLSPEAPRLLSFLIDGLGFTTTDWFEDFVTFVTCNRDHHVLNVMQAPFATLHHLAFHKTGAPTSSPPPAI